MPSNDEQAIEQNRRNSILDLQLCGIAIKLHERPDLSYSRPSSRSEYLTRPMSAIPLYFKEKNKGGMRDRPRSAGPQALRRKAHQSANQFSSPRSRLASSTNISKGLCSRSELSLHSTGGRRGGGRLEPGLVSKPPLPPARPVHTQSLDDIVNIKFLRWFPESANDREKEGEEDETVVRCDSSLGNDDISDLASSDSRLGFTSPDIALNTEGNLRPNRLHSPDCPDLSCRDGLMLQNTNAMDEYDSPRLIRQSSSSNYFDSPQLIAYNEKLLHNNNTVAHSATSQDKQEITVETSHSNPIYEQIKKLRSNSTETVDTKPPSPIFTKREKTNSRSNSASTSGSGGSDRKFDKSSRSISLDSAESACNSVIDNRFNESDVITVIESKNNSNLRNNSTEKKEEDVREDVLTSHEPEPNNTNNHTERNLRFGRTTMFDSNDSLFEPNSIHQNLSTPESVITPEPLTPRQKVQRSKFTYRACRNATPDSLTTPEPCPTPEPLPSTSRRCYQRDERRTKRVTIELNSSDIEKKRQSEEKTSHDSGVSERDFDTILDYDMLTVNTPIGDGKDKVSDDSGVRSLLTSVDSKVTPADNQLVSKHDEILSWMGNSLQENGSGGAEVTSTYNELMNMIKVIEHDEVESIKLEALSTGRSTNNSACSNTAPSPSGHATRDILGLLEGVEEASRSSQTHRTTESDGQRSVALAQRCMTLSDRLETERQRSLSITEQLKQTKEHLNKIKTDSESTISRHQAFINQLLKEKKALGEQCAALVKEVEAKHRKALKTVEERFTVDLKKQEEKLLTAEKIRREKWIDSKTKKIKEMTVAGLESELIRLSSSHQDELKELRRHHDEEVSRTESVWSRRLSQARDEAARDREAAITEERESARSRLQAEVSKLEADQREARRNLLQELREERQRAELQLERTLSDRSSILDSKYQQALVKLDEKLADNNKQHEEEMNRLREGLESERQSWLAHQTQALGDKEREVKAEAKRERDRHIEAAIRKLDQESVDKQHILENKLSRLKEGWEEERKDLEMEVKEVKKKLKEARREAEDARVEAETARSRTRLESETAAAQIAELKTRLAERSSEDSQTSGRLSELEQQLTRARALHQEALADKQQQLDLLYTRVKEAVQRKDDQIRALQRERDAAVEQCSRLESIMERRTSVD